MIRCPSERTLWLVQQGEGPAAQRAHLRACLRCAARYERLVRDLQVIGHTLQQAPPPAAFRWSPGATRRLVLAAAVALVVLAAVGAWMWRGSPFWIHPEPTASDAQVLAFLETVSEILSSTGDAGGAALPLLALDPEAGGVGVRVEESWLEERDEDSLPGL